jgi:hypothetical protein
MQSSGRKSLVKHSSLLPACDARLSCRTESSVVDRRRRIEGSEVFRRYGRVLSGAITLSTIEFLPDFSSCAFAVCTSRVANETARCASTCSTIGTGESQSGFGGVLVIFSLVMGLSRTKSHPAPSHRAHSSPGPVEGVKLQPCPLHVGHLAQSWMAMAL